MYDWTLCSVQTKLDKICPSIFHISIHMLTILYHRCKISNRTPYTVCPCKTVIQSVLQSVFLCMVDPCVHAKTHNPDRSYSASLCMVDLLVSIVMLSNRMGFTVTERIIQTLSKFTLVLVFSLLSHNKLTVLLYLIG